MTREEFKNFCKCGFKPFSGDRKHAITIGKKYGLTKNDIMTIRKMAGFSSPNIKPKLTAAQREEMVREYQKGGVSLSKLAKKYGVSRVSVFYWVDRARDEK